MTDRSPEYMEGLIRENERLRRERDELEETRQEGSFLATVVAVALGFGLGSLLFGVNCDLDI